MARGIIGIDFSGAADQWKPKRKSSNVWLAFGAAEGDQLIIDEIKPVQALEGEGGPFERLGALLGASDAVAGIDASFSVPEAFAADAPALWAQVAALPAPGRPFAKGEELVRLLDPDSGPHGLKVYRRCEQDWVKRGLNVRSNLWNGPRGGAAFTVAAMTLLHRHPGPVWPMRPGGQGALLAETYPAAQLKAFGLDPLKYGGGTAAAQRARETIVEALVRDRGLQVAEASRQACIDGADALDAVLCAYGAKALADGRHPRRLPASARSEGWIMIDEGASPPPAVERRAEPRPTRALVDPATEEIVQALFDRAFEAAGR